MTDAKLAALNQSLLDQRKMLAEWRKSQRHEWTLPSGLSVITRDVSIMDLALTGSIPEPLMTAIMNQAEKQGGVDLNVFKAFPEFGRLIDELVKLCMIEPQIAEVADDEHIALLELNFSDRMAIFNWANREVAALEPFRKEPGQPVQTAQPG
jgi:hypothetical protein